LYSAGLALGGLAAACAPAASQTPSPASSGAAPAGASTSGAAGSGNEAWQQQWDQLVAAAKKEGRVDINWILGGAGSYQGVIDDFAKAFPGIEPQMQNMASGSLLVPKVIQEHQAGVYSYDLFFTQVHFGQTVQD